MKKPYVRPASRPVTLSTDGNLVVTCLGAGSMLSSKENTAFLAVKGQDHVLFDCGSTVPDSLKNLGVDPMYIRNVVISHMHEDHAGGFGKLLRNVRFRNPIIEGEDQPKVKLYSDTSFAKKLWEHSLSGGLAMDDQAEVADARPETWYDIVPLTPSAYLDRDIYVGNIGGIQIELFRTMHTPPSADGWMSSAWSTGILVDGKLWISGDSRFDVEAIRSYVKRAEAMVHDAYSKLDPVHASLMPHELPSLPIATKSRMWLAHCNDDVTPELARQKGFRGLLEVGSQFIFD